MKRKKNILLRIALPAVTAFLTFLSACGPSPGNGQAADPASSALRKLTGARTKLVWVQDTGDNTDVMARGTDLRLMGLDTDDNRGERVILDGPRNFAKPFFTADGQHIIFSDRINGTCHIVDWEGSETRLLGEGFALTTWRDDSGKEWLYIAKEKLDEKRVLAAHRSIYRTPLYTGWFRNFLRMGRTPPLEEVWNQTLVSEDTFQLSADGRYASAVFPWPNTGLLNLETKEWQRIGRGCWMAMAPDNSYLFWIMDGRHRNVAVFKADTTERHNVRINNAPGINNYEVYHPRWSNHARIMAVTGPYKIGDSANRLGGGGDDVEIHVGRFSQDHREIEAWARATYNHHADFYPDVWVQPQTSRRSSRKPATPETSRKALTWPASREHLLYLWENGDSQNEIIDDDENHIICRPEPRQLARYGKYHEMLLKGGYFIDDTAIQPGGEFTIECIIHSDTEQSLPETLIIAHTGENEQLNFGLFEIDGQWVWRDNNGGQQTLCLVEKNKTTHLVVVRTTERITLYINGALTGEWAVGKNEQRWTKGSLLFGGHPERDMNWSGSLGNIAVYDTAHTHRTVSVNYHLAHELIAARPAPALLNVRARLVNASSIPTLEDIAPYTRALAANEYLVTEGEELKDRKILVAHWVILDGHVLPDAERQVDGEYDLLIEPFDERPELTGERLTMDTEDFTLDLYFDLSH